MKLYHFLTFMILWLCVTFYLMLVGVPRDELFGIIVFAPFLVIGLFAFSIQGFFTSLIIVGVYYVVKYLWFEVE